MLVLKRKIGERIVLAINGVEVEIEVVDVRGRQAKLGFAAPPDVKIWRKELLANGKEAQS